MHTYDLAEPGYQHLLRLINLVEALTEHYYGYDDQDASYDRVSHEGLAKLIGDRTRYLSYFEQEGLGDQIDPTGQYFYELCLFWHGPHGNGSYVALTTQNQH